ncbi:MAG: 50S ribosomal protein L21 [bacterium]|nr:50S ribosomal protein L21 [bacterium]
MVEAKIASKTPKKVASKAAKDRAEKFAVFATGGKQYRVAVGDIVKIEKIVGEYKEGDKITFDTVLMVDNGASEITLGNPFIKDGAVSATLTKIGRNKKIEVVKYKQKSRYFKRYGHRQPYFEIKIESIK